MKSIEKIINVIIIFILSGAVISHLNDENSISFEKDSPYSTIILYITYILILIVSAKWWNKIIQLIKVNKLFLLLAIIVVSSVAWSQAVDISARRVIPFLFGFIYAGYLSLRYNNKQFVSLLYSFSSIITILNILVIILIPSYGIAHDIDEGAWRGLYFHKNGLGRICAVCILFTFLHLKEVKFSNKLFPVLLLLLNSILLIKSNSVTPLISIFVVAGSYYYLRNYVQKNRSLPVFLKVLSTFTIFSIIIIYFNIDSFDLEFLGRDDSFSGRLPLWLLIFTYIAKSPIIGYGYSAFWVPAILEKTLWIDATWGPQQGHNGFIDVTLEIGFLGLSIILSIIIKSIKFRLKEVNIYSKIYDFWPYLYIIFTLTISMMETFLLRQNNLYWTLFLVAAFNSKGFQKKNLYVVDNELYETKKVFEEKIILN